jgi:hypothetical protein
MSDQTGIRDWLSAWPDALAFGIGLAVAWWGGWSTGDLVWSLWLSSLVVGYATIIWLIAQPAGELCLAAWAGRGSVGSSPRAIFTVWALILFGAAAILAFFSFHFLFFHYIHSQFVMMFFPIETGHRHVGGFDKSVYVEVVRRYWVFLPSAFLAHRAAFTKKPLTLRSDVSVGSLARERKLGSYMSEPYANVMRMHMLIFFFAFAHFAKLENFAVYAVVYAVYFFPWRLVRRRSLYTPAGAIDTRTPTQLRAV